MNDAAYFQRAVPEPFQILDLKLLPLSIGRYRLMRRFNVGFVADDDRNFEPADLILGLCICHMRVDEFLKWISGKDFAKDIRRWSRKVGRFDLLEKVILFKKYIADSTAFPAYWENSDGNGRESSSHWSQSLEIGLRTEAGWTDEEVNESPLSKAIADFFKVLENNGLLTLASKEEIESGKGNSDLFERLGNGA